MNMALYGRRESDFSFTSLTGDVVMIPTIISVYCATLNPPDQALYMHIPITLMTRNLIERFMYKPMCPATARAHFWG